MTLLPEWIFHNTFGMKSTIRFAWLSRRMRFRPTNRYCSSLGKVGKAINTDGGIVESGAVAGYVAFTARLTGVGDSPDFGFPSPRIVAFAAAPSFPSVFCLIVARTIP